MTRRKLHHAAIGAEALQALRAGLVPIVVLAFVGGGGLGRLVFYAVAGLVLSAIGGDAPWAATRRVVDGGGVPRPTRGVHARHRSAPPPPPPAPHTLARAALALLRT